MQREELIEYWYLAANSKYGIRIETNNPKLLMQQLYTARRAIDDPTLSEFSIAPDRLNLTGALLILRRDAVIPETEPTDDSQS